MKYRLFNFFLDFFKKKTVLILQDYVGLGNRLKQLASYHFCFGLNNTRLFWSTKGWVNRDFEDLFELKDISKFKITNIKIAALPVISFPKKIEFENRGYWRLFVDASEVDESFYIQRGDKTFPSIDFQYNNIPKFLLDRYIPFFNNLQPSIAVKQRIEETKIQPNDICVHVRNSTNKKDLANVPLISTFIDILKEYPQNTRFFLSAMDSEIAKLFYTEFGDRVFELPSKDYTSMIDAVADMYLLGKGKELILSDGSTFSEVAWWLGGCHQKVIKVPISYRQNG